MVNRLSFILLIICHTATQTFAQEEFIVGKSANSLNKGFTIISAEYSAFAFENIKARRAGLDIAYGASDRLSLFLRGSISDFPGEASEFETGTLSTVYKIKDIKSSLNYGWAIATFAQVSVLSNRGEIPQDINFDGNNSGFSIGVVINRNSSKSVSALSLSYAKLTLPRFQNGLLEGHGILYNYSVNRELNVLSNPGDFRVSVIVEVIGQYNNTISKDGNIFFETGSYSDVLGGLQFTAANTYRVEIALQKQVRGNVVRFSEGLYHIRLKYML